MGAERAELDDAAVDRDDGLAVICYRIASDAELIG
ncbi:hypothetical protein Mal64_06580 [Pseudobythopirellula maris]|uniref:Uncharacterized protein n=1 Tax=Pseudobythopirellula maris TaxID=2527991 RepID=A0A5C5ZVM0_9BACT|nr:hypothetical protein Mal64_06580 [Pseudobythopirellula maris]